MKIDTNDLILVKTFADLKGVSTTAVYNWLKLGVIKGVKIDGVKFIDNDNKKA